MAGGTLRDFVSSLNPKSPKTFQVKIEPWARLVPILAGYDAIGTFFHSRIARYNMQYRVI